MGYTNDLHYYYHDESHDNWLFPQSMSIIGDILYFFWIREEEEPPKARN